MINNPAEKTSREQAKHDTELTTKQGYSPAQIKLTENKLKQKRRERDMGRLYLLFKTDEFVVKDIVAVHESLEVLLALLKNNHELAEPKRLGQGWEIDLMTYDDTGKANLTLVNKFKKELVNCRQNDIQEGCYYNIIYKNKDGHDYKCLCKTRGIGKTKCIKSNPPEYIFGNREATGLQLNYDDIFIITKCREDEDDEDWDRFQYYSNVLQCKMSLVDSK